MTTVVIYPDSGVTVYKISLSANTGRYQGNPGPLSFTISCCLSRVQGYRIYITMAFSNKTKQQYAEFLFLTFYLNNEQTPFTSI